MLPVPRNRRHWRREIHNSNKLADCGRGLGRRLWRGAAMDSKACSALCWPRRDKGSAECCRGDDKTRGNAMQSTGVGEASLSFPRGLTRYQWTVFFVVWAGWALDATDFGLYSIVLRPALTDLLGGNPSMADIGRVGGILSMVGLLGWAFGGFLFGIVADYIGRVRTLALSILIYSVFTACHGFAESPLQLGV